MALIERVQELRECADKMEQQLRFESRDWIKGVVQRNVGGDVSTLLHDIRALESNWSGMHGTTRGQPKSSSRVRNSLGYQVDRSQSTSP